MITERRVTRRPKGARQGSYDPSVKKKNPPYVNSGGWPVDYRDKKSMESYNSLRRQAYGTEPGVKGGRKKNPRLARGDFPQTLGGRRR